MAWTKQNKNTNSWLKQLKKSSIKDLTWADMDMSWTDLEKMGDPTWSSLEAATWSKQSKNTSSYTNQTKN